MAINSNKYCEEKKKKTEMNTEMQMFNECLRKYYYYY